MSEIVKQDVYIPLATKVGAVTASFAVYGYNGRDKEFVGVVNRANVYVLTEEEMKELIQSSYRNGAIGFSEWIEEETLYHPVEKYYQLYNKSGKYTREELYELYNSKK